MENKDVMEPNPSGTVIVVEDGYYQLPMFKVVQGVGLKPVTLEVEGETKFGVLDIAFVRGDKAGVAEVTPREGITIECLLNMMIIDLKSKNEYLPSRESSIAITKLEEAQMWLMKRRSDRVQRKVEGTHEL